MTPENFCYWLQGFFELAGPDKLHADEVTKIREHLKQVFTSKITIPSGRSPTPTLDTFFKKDELPLTVTC